MLWQLHHQFKDGHTEMIAQREINNDDEMREWVKELWKSHPPPKGAVWLACNEKAEYFALTSHPSGGEKSP